MTKLQMVYALHLLFWEERIKFMKKSPAMMQQEPKQS